MSDLQLLAPGLRPAASVLNAGRDTCSALRDRWTKGKACCRNVGHVDCPRVLQTPDKSPIHVLQAYLVTSLTHTRIGLNSVLQM